MSGKTIKLTNDEALVLFEYLSRSIDNENFQIKHKAELSVLAGILCHLEESVVEIFDQNYQEKLKFAQEKLSN